MASVEATGWQERLRSSFACSAAATGQHQTFDSPLQYGPMSMSIPRIFAFSLMATASLVATSVHARRRGGSHGEDPFPWLTEAVMYVLLGMLALAVLGALWRYFTRPSAADLARERSMRRLSRREEKGRRRPQR